MNKKIDNTIKNWGSLIGDGLKKDNKIEDKNFKNHLILPNSVISMIGGTGSGKSNCLIDFLSRTNETFYEIILFSGSTTDEKLYDFLKSKIKGIKLIDNIEELPELENFYGQNNDEQKLIIFDDIINLKNNEITKIKKFINSARKVGFTMILMSQNFTDLPIQIRRNTMYYLLFKLNDNTTINTIIKNHNTDDINKETVKEMYKYSTKDKGNFFMIDFRNEKTRFRHNFLEILNPDKF